MPVRLIFPSAWKKRTPGKKVIKSSHGDAEGRIEEEFTRRRQNAKDTKRNENEIGAIIVDGTID